MTFRNVVYMKRMLENGQRLWYWTLKMYSIIMNDVGNEMPAWKEFFDCQPVILPSCLLCKCRNCHVAELDLVPKFSNLQTCFFRYYWRLYLLGRAGKIHSDINFSLTCCPPFVGIFSSVKTFHTILQAKSSGTGMPFLAANCVFLTSMSILFEVRNKCH